MGSHSKIRVLLVEDHPRARAGLELFIEAFPDLLLLGQVATGEEAIEFCDRSEPDVIVMDIKLPGIDGITTTASIRGTHPGVQVVALSTFREQDLVERAFEAGVNSYVLKTSPAHDLIDAIRAAYIPVQPPSGDQGRGTSGQ
ncbi:MAG: response regulator transcription factor [Chloroflexia bacterium]